MKIPEKIGRWILYVLIFISGMSGLIYEVVWHRYLAILLGAQARATAIVLAIFLGGISAGYACFGRWSHRKTWNLLKAYVAVEIGMGLWGLAFPTFFHLFFPVVATKLYSVLGLNNLMIDVFLSILLIGVPTFLMGGTLPLLTQGLSRDLADASQTHARIYGFNTLGACVGCLFAGYFFIPAGGLAETTRIAGGFNLIVALSVYLLFAKGAPAREIHSSQKSRAGKIGFTTRQKVLLGIGFLSGLYLITLQTVLIRLMGLSTGASNYNFTLIVSIFILGLGIGSLLVRGIGTYSISRLFWNQLFVSLALFLLYLSGDDWSYWVHHVRLTLRDIPQNFFLYQALLGILFGSLLIVPIGLSGLTLPLCFHLIKDDEETLGERVGQLYGLNTVGCVMGALVGGYFLLNFIDLDALFKVCVLLSLGTAGAAAYLYFPETHASSWRVVSAGALAGLALAGTLWAPFYSRNRFIQPFRHPSPMEASFDGPEKWGKYLGRSTDFVFWKDDPNTSVGIGASMYKGQELSRTIFINGKSDGNTNGDSFTTLMLAHIPGLLATKLDNVCVIGFGTGETIGNLTLYPEVARIDVAEISHALIKNSYLFDEYNYNASASPKVHFNEMDAFRFLEGTNHGFDLIVSEPSNPWVAGIENLYSKEFYQIAKSKMNPDGLFIQWIHTYSFNDELFQMTLKTMGKQFPNLSVFQLRGGDIALLGALRPFTKEDIERGERRFGTDIQAQNSMKKGGITRFDTVLALEIIPAGATAAMSGTVPEHTLESPKLSNEAAQAFFVGSSAHPFNSRRLTKEYYSAVGSSLMSLYRGDQPTTSDMVDGFKATFCESDGGKNETLCEETLAMAKMLNPAFSQPKDYEASLPDRDLASMPAFQKPVDKRFTVDDLQEIYSLFDIYKKYYSPLARLPLAPMMSRVDSCLHSIPHNDELYGECLLQKVVVFETTAENTPTFTTAVNEYLTWFPTLSSKSPNYSKLEEARNILVKMSGSLK